MKKFLCVNLIFVMMIGSIVFPCPKRASAKIPYSSPWGLIYREPDIQNSYGRAWYEITGNHSVAWNYLEPFYNYGSSVTIKYMFKDGRYKKTGNSAQGSSSVKTTYSNSERKRFTCVHFIGNSYGFNYDSVR